MGVLAKVATHNNQHQVQPLRGLDLRFVGAFVWWVTTQNLQLHSGPCAGRYALAGLKMKLIVLVSFVLFAIPYSYGCDELLTGNDLEHESAYDVTSYYRILKLMDQNDLEAARSLIEQYQMQEIAKLDIYRVKCGLSKETEELLKKVDSYNKKTSQN